MSSGCCQAAITIGRTRRPRLVFFDFVTHFGGAQRSTVEVFCALRPYFEVAVLDAYGATSGWITALQRHGIHTQVILPDARGHHLGHPGRPLLRLGAGLAQLPQFGLLCSRLWSLLAGLDPQWVLTNTPKGLAFLWGSGAFTRYRIAFYARGWYRRSQTPWWARALIRRAEVILAVSTPTARALADWGVRSDKIHLLGTFIEPEQVLAVSAQPLAAPVGGLDRALKVLMPAQLDPDKGHATAIRAAAILRDKDLDLAMWLAGDLKEGTDTGYPQALRSMVRKLGLDDRVFLLGLRDDILQLIRASDVVILPSRTEGLPRAIMEAQIIGTPVVATCVGGVADLVIDGQTGLLVRPDDPADLANALIRLAKHADLGKRLAGNAARRIRGQFPTARQLEQLVQILNQA